MLIFFAILEFFAKNIASARQKKYEKFVKTKPFCCFRMFREKYNEHLRARAIIIQWKNGELLFILDKLVKTHCDFTIHFCISTYVEAWRQGIGSKRSDTIVSIQDSQDQMIEKYIDFYEPFYHFGKPLRLIWQFSRNWTLCIHRQIIQLLSCMRAHSNASARATIAQPGTT